MGYLEKNMQSIFTSWLDNERKEGRHKVSMVWELKVIKKSERIGASHFRPQQLPSLYDAKHDCVYMKLSDADPRAKPCDAMQICYSPAYVVVEFYNPKHGAPHITYWIDIDDFICLLEEAYLKGYKTTTKQDIINHPNTQTYEIKKSKAS